MFLLPLLILLAIVALPALVAAGVRRWAGMPADLPACGRVGIAVLFGLAGIAHFVAPEPFVSLFPTWVSAAWPGLALWLVYFTGVCECAGAAGVLVPRWRRAAGWSLVVFLLCVLPANIAGAINRVDVAGHGLGPVMLLVRIPLQGALMAWVYWCCVRPPSQALR
ncbi:MAG: DoxX family protein [Phycisphaerales bacterium]